MHSLWRSLLAALLVGLPLASASPDTAHGYSYSPGTLNGPLRGSVGLREGIASWYDDGPGLYAAAGPALRVGEWRGKSVRVCAGEQCVAVRLTDWCQCYGGTSRERLIDLSRDAFAVLAPLSRGLVVVTISAFRPPQTDTLRRWVCHFPD